MKFLTTFRVALAAGLFRQAYLALPVAGMLLLVGCAAPAPIEPIKAMLKDVPAVELEEQIEDIKSDPVAYLRDVLERTRTLDQYTVLLTRQERRGLIPTLREPERIRAWFRREPFSVRMKWVDDDVKYGESTYVAGEDNDRVRFVPRRWTFGLKMGVNKIDLNTPVVFGESRYPLTDFGLERLMERTFVSIERGGEDAIITYEGLAQLSEADAIAHEIRLEFPPSQHKAPIQELFIDVETQLPVFTRILFPNGDLEAAYIYAHVNPDVELVDDDFLLDLEREERGLPPRELKGFDEPTPPIDPSQTQPASATKG